MVSLSSSRLIPLLLPRGLVAVPKPPLIQILQPIVIQGLLELKSGLWRLLNGY